MKVAVLGAGCGGQAIAGYLSSTGHDVNLYNRSVERIVPLMADPKIELDGAIESVGRLNKVTTNAPEAVSDTDLIMIVTTATGHKDIAANIAPYLDDGQTIVLNPGRTFGALEFITTLLENGCEADINVAEANTLIYATSITTKSR